VHPEFCPKADLRLALAISCGARAVWVGFALMAITWTQEKWNIHRHKDSYTTVHSSFTHISPKGKRQVSIDNGQTAV
jgi:hypothetical protein